MTVLARQRLWLPAWSEIGAWPRTCLLIALGWAGLLLFFFQDTAMLADVYWNSSVYEHCVVIIPVIGWLVWQRTDVLRQISPTGWWPALLLMAAGLVCWLVGYATDINVGRHLGLIVMMQAMALALIGPNAGRALLFPFCYALFLLPVGDQLVAPMQTLTAHLSMALLGLSGLEASLDGIFITTDAGYFRVAEACAGVNFLIAMFALAVLVANIGFKSWSRRLLFIAAAIVLPILGNGVRAWGTMVIAHLYGVQYASGFDHIFYGWFFFALITAVLLGAAWRFFDRQPGEHGLSVERFSNPVRGRMQQGFVLTLALAIVLPGAWLSIRSDRAEAASLQALLPAVERWEPVDTPDDYLPTYRGADHRVMQRYRNAAGQEVDLFVALYGNQGEGAELVAVNQGGSDADNGWVWTQDSAPFRAGDAVGRGEMLTAPDKRKREAAVFYRLGGETTSDVGRVKWLMLKQRLLGGDQHGMAIVLSAEEPNARASITAFLNALGPLGDMADRVTGTPVTN